MIVKTGPSHLDLEKYHHVLGRLESGESVHLHLDGRIDGVLLPDDLLTCHSVTVVVGVTLDTPLTRLRVSYEGINGWFSFNKTPFDCFIPWASLYGTSDPVSHHILGYWLQSLPPEMLPTTTTPEPPKPSHLKLVK